MPQTTHRFCLPPPRYVHGNAELAKLGGQISKGWSLYNFAKEMARQRVPNSKWRLCSINAKYEICPTYPAQIAVPASLSDEDVAQAAKFRSKAKQRLPTP